MKARIKATEEELEVHLVDKQARYIGSDGVTYWEEDLDFGTEDKDTPDYWTRLEHQAAIAAMGGMCGNTKYNDYAWVDMAKFAIKAAHALVEKMKEEK